MTEERIGESGPKSKGLSTAAWYSGQAAKNDGAVRLVPDKWQKYADEWLAGYDNKEKA